MNGETWEKLNPDEQALIMEAGKVFRQKAYDIAIKNIDVYENTVETSGRNEVYKLTDAEQKQFIELAYGLYKDMASQVGDKGNQLINLLKEINGIK